MKTKITSLLALSMVTGESHAGQSKMDSAASRLAHALRGVAASVVCLFGFAHAAELQWSPPARPRPLAAVIAQAEKEDVEFVRLLNHPKLLTMDAVKTFTSARALYREGYFAQCQQTLADFWIKNPRNSPAWGPQQENVGYKLGYPCAYPALVMLTDAVAWRVKEKLLPKAVEAADWNVVVLPVGKGSGVMPSNDEEAKAGKGTPMSATIDPTLLADGNALVRDVVWLTRQYYRAMTEGKINLRVGVVHLADVNFELCAPGGPGGRGRNLSKLLPAIPPDIARQADWYWLIYPEIEPPEGAKGRYYLASYDEGGTISGGMTALPGTGRPMVMCEDHWLTRRSAGDGRGPTHPVSRQTYIPYWLQHEFFHDHFGRNKHLELEVTPHQWFDRSTWPADFVGRYEPDYYEEAMTKRLQKQARPSLAGYFIHRNTPPSQPIRPKDVIGRYSVVEVENGWGSGEIKLAQGRLEWVNDAGKSWGLKMKPGGILETDKRNPYFDKHPNFEIMAARGPDGLPGVGVGAFRFGGQEFLRKP